MKTIRVAQRYAKALLDLANELKIQEDIYQDMLLVQSVSEVKSFKNMLVSPIISSVKKVEVINVLFEGKIQKLTMDFLSLIIRKKREYNILQIADQFVESYKNANGILTTEIQTAVALDEEIKSNLIKELKAHTGASAVELGEKVKEELLGGFVLKYKNMQYDASIRTKLNDLKKSLT